MTRIVITEFMDERAVAQLAAAHEVLYDPQLVDDGPGLLAQALNADALIVRNRTQVRGELLQSLNRCKVVGRLGVGLDNIDVSACAVSPPPRRLMPLLFDSSPPSSTVVYTLSPATRFTFNWISPSESNNVSPTLTSCGNSL